MKIYQEVQGAITAETTKLNTLWVIGLFYPYQPWHLSYWSFDFGLADHNEFVFHITLFGFGFQLVAIR